MIECKIKLIEGGKIPVKGSKEAAYYDCFARKMEVINNQYHYWLGFALHPINEHGNDPLMVVNIKPRSSVCKTGLYLNQENSGLILSNIEGVGDQDYRGEYKAVFYPVQGQNIVPYEAGDRVCQMNITFVEPINFMVCESLNETERGEGGYGSTGK